MSPCFSSKIARGSERSKAGWTPRFETPDLPCPPEGLQAERRAHRPPPEKPSPLQGRRGPRGEKQLGLPLTLPHLNPRFPRFQQSTQLFKLDRTERPVRHLRTRHPKNGPPAVTWGHRCRPASRAKCPAPRSQCPACGPRNTVCPQCVGGEQSARVGAPPPPPLPRQSGHRRSRTTLPASPAGSGLGHPREEGWDKRKREDK